MHTRALTLMTASVLTIAFAGIAYLHPLAGGAIQPRVSAVSDSYHLAALDFVNPTTGWVAATLDSGRFAVLRTSDAGESWTSQLTGATDQRTVYLRFFDSRHGVLGLMGPRPALFRTADGGQTWLLRPMSPATYLLSMSFVDPDHGWLLFHTGELTGTVDGGASWADLGVPVAADDQAFRVQFIDREVGWLDSGSARPVAYKSVDGGVSWRTVPLPAPGGGWPVTGEFFVAAQPTQGAGVVATVVHFAPYKGRSGVGERVVAYPPLTVRAFDGGRPVWYSYSVFADAIPGGDLRGHKNDQVTRWSTQIQAPDQVQMGSLDAGASWSIVSPPNGSGAVGYSNAQTWWWIGSGAWSTSSDGGSTWTRSRNIGVIEPLPGSLQVLDSSHAWYGAMAGGTRAMLERTADAGLHWEMIGLPPIQR
jgi:photosystem II stability/assembly factor-like uncharacterized protein